MTIINPKSIAGVTSITTPSGSDNLFTVHTNNTTERVRINNDGDVIVGSGITVSPDGDIFTTGVCTATSFVGSGANLTGVASTENIRTNTNATFLQNINVSGSTTTGSLVSSGAISGTTGTFTGNVDIADKIIHTGDTNTSLRFPSADTFTVETGGSERFRVDSDGHFGIGMSPSGVRLDVTSSVNDIARFSGQNSGGITIRNDTNHELQLHTGTSDDLIFGTNGENERMRIDSSGRIGLGNDLSNSYDSTYNQVVIGNGADSNNGITFHVGTGSGTYLGFKDTTDGTVQGLLSYTHNNDAFAFSTAGAERMRIDSSGRILIGTSSETFAKVCLKVNAANDQPFSINDSGNNSSLTSRIGFRTGNTQVGTIKSNQSSTQYNTSSDYRLKENAVAISDGITRIKTLKPYKFNWIVDETDTVIDGFFAHEVSNVVPEAISGTKDQIADSADVARGDAMKVGDPVYQQIDQSKLVPLLTAALQEAVTKIEVLETRLNNAGIAT